jgi:hypothetical protein
VLLVVGVGGVVVLSVGQFGESYIADRTVSGVLGSVGDVGANLVQPINQDTKLLEE